jgi:hypothetical protein
MSGDDGRERFERERARQGQRREELERNAVAAFAEWLGEVVKGLVKSAVQAFWDWFRK